MNSLIVKILLLVLLLGALSSCSDIRITKRRYRPGFHVDLGARKDRIQPKTQTSKQKQRIEKHTVFKESGSLSASAKTEYFGSQRMKRVENVFIQAVLEEPVELPDQIDSKSTETRLGRIAKKKSEHKGEGEMWSRFSIIAFFIPFVGLILLISAIGILVSWLYKSANYGNNPAPWFLSPIAFLHGVSGFVIGLMGYKRAKKRMQKGKGLGVVALIVGAVVMVISLIVTLILFGINGYP